MSSAGLAVLAPAKINLFLRVTGRRADGYHELDSVFLPIALYDQVGVRMRADHGQITLRCDLPGIPHDSRNLAVRAAQRLCGETTARPGIEIDLRKRIPVGAGLGGGSSDAGAVLRLLAEKLTSTATRLSEAALAVGADVPFFLAPRPARVGGIGELIEPLRWVGELALVVAVPPCEVSTREIYEALRPGHWSGPAPGGWEPERPEWADLMVNDLEGPALARYPVIGELKVELKKCGAQAALMSGSGGAVFGLCRDPEHAAYVTQRMAWLNPGIRCYATHVLEQPPPISAW
jgi:4-diphosphocytidyl-2-C-methyl-D-erythritol kinase